MIERKNRYVSYIDVYERKKEANNWYVKLVMEIPICNVLKHIGQNPGESFQQSDPIMILLEIL